MLSVCPMGVKENRAKYNRDHLRYPSDLTDDEWTLVEPFIPPAKSGGGKRRTDMRAVMNGVMYILSTGCQWRYIPKDFPPRSTLHDYFTWWICDGRQCAARAGSGTGRDAGRLPVASLRGGPLRLPHLFRAWGRWLQLGAGAG